MRHVFFTLSILLLLPSGRQPATARPTVAATVPTLRISRTADAGIFAKTAQPGLPEAADRTTAPADRTTGRVTGCVVDLKTGAAVCGAVVGAGDGTLWTSTDRVVCVPAAWVVDGVGVFYGGSSSNLKRLPPSADAPENLQFFALMTTFTSTTYPEGRTSLAYSHAESGLQLRCIADRD